MKKLLISLLLIAALTASVFAAPLAGAGRTGTEGAVVSVRVEGKFGNLLYLPRFTITGGDGLTVYDAVTQALESGGVSYISDGGYISSIGGQAAGESSSGYDGWMYLLNGQLCDVGMDSQPISCWDEITLYYGYYLGYGTELAALSASYEGDALTLTINGGSGPMSGVRVTLTGGDTFIATTDDNGEADFIGVSSGKYSAALSKPDPEGVPTLVRTAPDCAIIAGDGAALVRSSSDTLACARDAARYTAAQAAPGFGSIGGEWAVIGLVRGGYELPEDFTADYYNAVSSYIAQRDGVLSSTKSTEYSRVILALTAIGRDPSSAAGYDLFSRLTDVDMTLRQGLNGPIWALIALDCGAASAPQSADAQAIRQLYVDEILSRQLECGGWSLTGDADPGVTAMALQALTAYQQQEQVSAAVDEALAYLSRLWLGGGFDDAETTSQVIIALCGLGISPDDERFSRDGLTPVDGLLAYRDGSGGFKHLAGDTGASLMSTEQALLALTAVLRAEAGQSPLYSMADVPPDSGPAVGEGLSGKIDDVKPLPIIDPDASFTDISDANASAAVSALASRGVINGRGDGLFDPCAHMTRAEFAAVVVRALGLTPKATDSFEDVAPDSWYAPYVGAAYSYEIVCGVSDRRFDPDGLITRQEAAVMAARTAALCGMDISLSDSAVRNTLAQFDDYTTADSWARGPLAFCVNAGIIDSSPLSIQPKEFVSRQEIAQMIYSLLRAAELI